MRILRTIILVASTVGACAQTVPAEARFVMSYFKADNGGGDERLYISTSPDAVTWTNLHGGAPAWQPPGWAPFTNIVRDPAILYHDGWFWVAFTSGNYGLHKAFGLVKSQDLVNWTYLGNIQIPVPGATASTLTWNPTWFRDGDGSVRLFISIALESVSYGPNPHMKTYVTNPTNAEWTTWATPVPLALPNFNTNEFYCWKEEDVYHGIYVDFQYGGSWKHVSAPDISGTWSTDQLLGFYGKEGGMMLKKPGGGYRFFIEYGNGAATTGFRYSDCSDTLTAFTPETAVISDTPMRNGKMTLLPGATNFSTWAAATTPGDPSLLADPDRDGTANILEAALVQSPTAWETKPTPFLTQSGRLGLKFRRTIRFAGLGVEAEFGTTPGAFAPIPPISRTMMADGTELIETRAPAGSNGFLRLRATQLP
jgi:hypothetical protein